MSRNKRIEVDVKKLMNSNFDVELQNDNLRELRVKFLGPTGTPYEGGTWYVRVELPEDYPYRSPSVVFTTPMFHPNVDDATGSVCLDVINQMWKPIFGLVNVFESFLPQLLSYPNASDPLNRKASSLYMKSQDEYNAEIKRYVNKYASGSIATKAVKANGTNGANGANGVNGTKSTNGTNGVHLSNGINGTNSVHSPNGANGTNGGSKGANGTTNEDMSDSEMSSLDELSDDDEDS